VNATEPMDPTELLDRITGHIDSGDWLDALTAAATLKIWCTMGGAPPEGMTRRQAISRAEQVYDLAESIIGAGYYDTIEAMEGSRA
jgi:hypothetical protein